MNRDGSHNISRRRLLYILGGAAGVVVAADTLFAKQFARETTPQKLPDMVYDPDLQMMVDPATRQPLYSRAVMLAAKDQDQEKPPPSPTPKSTPKPLPTVTAGCNDCPKCDDDCG
jgi:hypothetical protein